MCVCGDCVLTAGSVLCDVSSPVDTATRFRARIVIFNINFPITKGFPVSAVSVSVSSHFSFELCTWIFMEKDIIMKAWWVVCVNVNC